MYALIIWCQFLFNQTHLQMCYLYAEAHELYSVPPTYVLHQRIHMPLKGGQNKNKNYKCIEQKSVFFLYMNTFLC